MSARGTSGIAAGIDDRFGTENVAPLLYALIRFTRPRSLLEVGAGLSTLSILRALRDNVADDARERSDPPPRSGVVPEYYFHPYRPRLVVLDDLSNSDNLAHEVAENASRLGFGDLVSFQNRDFRGFSRLVDAEALPFDFIWFDCGGLGEYIDFVNEYWPVVNPDGGLVILHSTQSNLSLRLFADRLKERSADADGVRFEFMSLVEPHKTCQNSVTIVRMTSGLRTPLFSLYP